MSDLLWRCANGGEMSTEANGIRLVVAPAPQGDGYRYQLLGPAGERRANVALASGHRHQLRDAMEAAERTAQGFVA